MDSLKKIQGEKIHLTLTLAEVDALAVLGENALRNRGFDWCGKEDVISALQKLDEAVNA